MNNPQTNESVGPPKISALNFALKIMGGITGGITGTLIMFGIYLLSTSIILPVLKTPASEPHPIFMFIFLGMIFLSSLLANLIGTILIAYSDPKHYRNIASMIYQIFTVNLIIFILIAPLYLLASRVNLSFLVYMSGIHIVLSAQASALILKIIAHHKYALLGVYSNTLAILVALGLDFLIYNLSGYNLSILVLISIPLIWFSLAFFEAVTGIVYYQIYQIYGVDFLSSSQKYGNDYYNEDEQKINDLTDEEKENLILEQKQDETGESFLKKRGE